MTTAVLLACVLLPILLFFLQGTSRQENAHKRTHKKEKAQENAFEDGAGDVCTQENAFEEPDRAVESPLLKSPQRCSPSEASSALCLAGCFAWLNPRPAEKQHAALKDTSAIKAAASAPTASPAQIAAAFANAVGTAGNQLEAIRQLEAAEAAGQAVVGMLDPEAVARMRHTNEMWKGAMDLLQPQDFKGRGWFNYKGKDGPDEWYFQRPDGSCQSYMSQVFDNMNMMDAIVLWLQPDLVAKHYDNPTQTHVQPGEILVHNSRDSLFTYEQLKDDTKGLMDRGTDHILINGFRDPIAMGHVSIWLNTTDRSGNFPQHTAPPKPKDFSRQNFLLLVNILRPLPGGKTEFIQAIHFTFTSAEATLVKWSPSIALGPAFSKVLACQFRDLRKAINAAHTEIPERRQTCPFKPYYDSISADIERTSRS
eukprot:gnl/TRDRNA2_/TRDRNA2_191251_c0_seq1.p1 gnl/TRDRNA2_/TRDRNA2_191251_c0~~gnl/TRDRNA2_/TRDRNA2_191251_c0_seq1.p1  ORF type:complete len:451 (-),score=50.76 gnl/TRDRNA2_/TRDRNA2_191251_c0_seq1:70-1341(-)